MKQILMEVGTALGAVALLLYLVTSFAIALGVM